MANNSIDYTVVKLPEKTLVYTNCVYLSPEDPLFQKNNLLVAIKHLIYNVEFNKNISNGTIGLSAIQREDLSITEGDRIKLLPIVSDVVNELVNIKISFDFLKNPKVIETERIIDLFQVQYRGKIMSKGKHFLVNVDGFSVKIKIIDWDDACSFIEISPNVNFVVVEDIKESSEQKNPLYFEFNNRWFEVPNINKIIGAIRNLMMENIDKGLIKSFTDTPLLPTDKNIGTYNDLRIYLASLFLGLADVE